MPESTENSNSPASGAAESYSAPQIEQELAEILRARGWTVQPPGQGAGAAYAYQLDLPSRGHNCLNATYSDGEKNPRPSQLTQKPFRVHDWSDYEGKPLTVHELAKDIRRHEDVILRTRNLGERTLDKIKNALKEKGAL